MPKATRPQINLRASLPEIAAYERAAAASGLTLSEWLRGVANRAACRKLGMSPANLVAKSLRSAARAGENTASST